MTYLIINVSIDDSPIPNSQLRVAIGRLVESCRIWRSCVIFDERYPHYFITATLENYMKLHFKSLTQYVFWKYDLRLTWKWYRHVVFGGSECLGFLNIPELASNVFNKNSHLPSSLTYVCELISIKRTWNNKNIIIKILLYQCLSYIIIYTKI